MILVPLPLVPWRMKRQGRMVSLHHTLLSLHWGRGLAFRQVKRSVFPLKDTNNSRRCNLISIPALPLLSV